MSLWPTTPSASQPAAPPPVAAPAAHDRSVESPPRWKPVSVAGRRVHLSLGWPHLLVTGVLAAAVLWAVYHAGARSVQPSTPAEGDLDFLLVKPSLPAAAPVSAAPPTPARGRTGGPVATPLGPRPESPPSPEPAATEAARDVEEPDETYSFAADSYYVVVQHFPRRGRAAADAARDFLRSKGIDCVVHSGAGDWMLVATQRFATEREAARLQARVRELGREYFNVGRYDFKDAAARKF